MKRKRIHVFMRGTKFGIIKDEAKRALRIFDDKSDAITNGFKMVLKGYDLVVHTKDGTVDFWIHAEEIIEFKTKGEKKI